MVVIDPSNIAPWSFFSGLSRPIHLTVFIEFDPGMVGKGVLTWCTTSLHQYSLLFLSFFLCASRFSQFHQGLSWQMRPPSSYINSLTSRCQSAWGHPSIQFQFLLKSRGNTRMELSWKMTQGTQFLETDWRWPSLVSFSQTMDYTLSMSVMSLDLIYRRSTWQCLVSFQVLVCSKFLWYRWLIVTDRSKNMFWRPGWHLLSFFHFLVL